MLSGVAESSTACSALPRLASKSPPLRAFFRHFVRFFRHFVRFCGVLGRFWCVFAVFLGCISPVMSDFDLQIFGGVTRLAGARALPPWGTAGDLCAKFVLYAMKTRKNHPEIARKPARTHQKPRFARPNPAEMQKPPAMPRNERKPPRVGRMPRPRRRPSKV